MTGDMPAMASSAYGTSANQFNLAGIQPQLAANRLSDPAMNFLRVQIPNPKPEKPAMTRRLVQVFIADPDENLPLAKSLLYSGEQKLTDATDQELFFEIDMRAILEKHNAERIEIINKKVKERTEYLEPAKIRDLKMVVVNVATF